MGETVLRLQKKTLVALPKLFAARLKMNPLSVLILNTVIKTVSKENHPHYLQACYNENRMWGWKEQIEG
jgi:hypothetical protein